MADWPTNMAVGPIGEWPGAMTARRIRSNFSAPQRSTLELLSRELRELGGKNVELLVAIEANQFRLDGYPRATARASHPGIILSLDSKFGHLSYPCDTFDRWEDNLRAIALALEALRKVDRYGVTKRGEQYRGFLAIEATAMPASISSVQEALDIVFEAAGMHVEHGVNYEPDALARILRRALFRTHPDQGGNTESFLRVTAAEALLRSVDAL